MGGGFHDDGGEILVTDSSLLRPEYSSSSLRSSSKSVSVASERGRGVEVRGEKSGTGPLWNMSDSCRRTAADVKAWPTLEVDNDHRGRG